MKRRSILAIAAAALVITAGASPTAGQMPSSRRGEPLPEGRRIDARDGDLIVADHDARIRFLRRRSAVVRIIFNPTERWALMLADVVPPNGSADGYADYTYNWRQIEGTWPIDQRWEGTVVIEEYLSPGFAPNGMGVVLPEGRLQFINGAPARDDGFADPGALAVLSYRSAGSGGASRETFDQLEPRATAAIVANAGNTSSSFSTFSGPGGISGEVSFGAVAGGVTRTGAEPNAPIRVGGSIAAPRKVRDVAAIYPEAMRQSGLSGTVIMEVIIETDGTIRSAKVLRGLTPQIDQAALDAAKQWRYEPVLLNGVPVPVILTATVLVKP